MRTYPEYKDSGVEWIGEIPKEWDHIRLKYLSHIKTGDRNTEDSEVDGEFPFFVRSQTIERISTYSFDGEAILTAGDGVGVGKVFHYFYGRFDYHQRVYKFSYFNKVYGKYLFYYMREHLFYELLRWNAKSTVDSVRLPFLQNFVVTFPPLPEQKQISDYLDRKTQQIDDLIEKTERKIKLLKEQRSSLINQCVTKGLDPNVEMKDSGIEWIGGIPKGWEITRMVSVGEFSKGRNITKDELRETGYPCIVYSQLYTEYERLVTSVVSFIDHEKFQQTTKVNPGTFLFTSSGETIEDIGKCVLYDGDLEVSVGGDMVVFKIHESLKFDTYFLSYVFNSDFFQYQKSANSRGEIVVHVYERQLRDMRFPIPSPSEQKQISDHLDRENSKIDQMVNIETKRVEILKEYRQSLISNVVTGKIDVRDEVIQ